MLENPVLCPSSKCAPGVILLGMLQPDGMIAYTQDRVILDENFVARASEELFSPEEHFRFSSPCMKGACSQWTGSRCGVIDRVLEVIAPLELLSLPKCSIREQCRWFAQSGANACHVCPLVVTDARGLEMQVAS